MQPTAPPRRRLLPLLLPQLLLFGLMAEAEPATETPGSASVDTVFTARAGAPVFLPGPAARPDVRAVRGWSVLAGACSPPVPEPVCLDDRECFTDVALDAACLRTARVAPLAIAELAERPDSTGDKEFVLADPHVSAQLGRNATGVLIAAAAEEDGGVYFLYDRLIGDAGDEETQLALTLQVATAGAQGAARDEEREPATGPTPGPPPHRTTTRAPPRRHGARFRVLPYHSHVYTPGDSFLLSVRLQSEFFDEAPFSASIDWYFLRTAGDCALIRIYETCIFHPEAPACLHPADAQCSFASPYRSETVYSRLYEQCRPDPAGRWPHECEGAAYAAPVAHLRPANNSVDLVFDDAPAAASGLYVFVLQYNGHVEAWDYSLVVTSDRLVRAVTDHTRPEAAAADAPEPGPPLTSEPAGAPTGPAPWLVVLVGALGLAGLVGIAALAVRVCARRASQKRTYDILNPFGPVYTSLPTNEPLDVVVPVSDDEFSLDEDSFADDDSDDDGPASNPPADAYDLAGAPEPTSGFARAPANGTRSSRSGFKVWFRDPPEDDAAPARAPAAPDYTVVAARLKSILR
uniref:Envelope glycoprotein E n=10 Tax=Bovine herpesvirus 1 TaxID=10320 RepID=GE_BHV1S|nr:RecName: Full=Envelope glycoprotein E; Short=gE; Flags: Precursor [Bovine herpesvirus type 1.2 strain st]CAA80606.1 glycoprotein gE [Bovine alphaherpesvirus 1]